MGNILYLPQGVWKDKMFDRIPYLMNDYFETHAQSWYDFYLQQGQTIPKGPLKIVSCAYKCSAWALATCSTGSSENIFAELFKEPLPGSGLYVWNKHGKVDGKTGSFSKEIVEGTTISNQCVAIEVFSIGPDTEGSLAKRVKSSVMALRNAI